MRPAVTLFDLSRWWGQARRLVRDLPEEDRVWAGQARGRALVAHRTARRALLRRVLARRLGVPACEVALRRDPGGRPSVDAAEEIHVSTSHSGPFVAIALGATPVGVDVEQMRRLPDWRALAGDHFSPREVAHIGARSGAEAEAATLRLWTLKEAVAKAQGSDLLEGLPVLDLPPQTVGAGGTWCSRVDVGSLRLAGRDVQRPGGRLVLALAWRTLEALGHGSRGESSSARGVPRPTR